MQQTSKNNRRGHQNKGGRNHSHSPKNHGEKRPEVEHTRKSAATILGQVFHAIRLDQQAHPNRWSKEARTSMNEMKKAAVWLLAEGQYNDAVERALDTAERFKVRFKIADAEAETQASPAESAEA